MIFYPYTEGMFPTKFVFFERIRLKVAKKISNLTFLKRYRDASVIPSFAIIKHKLNLLKNFHIFLKVNISLVRSEIFKMRRELDKLSKELLTLHLILSNFVSPSLWSRVDAG